VDRLPLQHLVRPKRQRAAKPAVEGVEGGAPQAEDDRAGDHAAALFSHIETHQVVWRELAPHGFEEPQRARRDDDLAHRAEIERVPGLDIGEVIGHSHLDPFFGRLVDGPLDPAMVARVAEPQGLRVIGQRHDV
jgi:hypothetical protein